MREREIWGGRQCVWQAGQECKLVLWDVRGPGSMSVRKVGLEAVCVAVQSRCKLILGMSIVGGTSEDHVQL